METVTEKMVFSSELNIYVLTKGSDPRSGETSLTRTTNMRPLEPDPSLFRVPADYTISQQ